MQPELSRVIEQVSREKGIDRSIVVHAVENAMLSAARRVISGEMRLEAQYNPDLGEVELFKTLVVVEKVTNPETEVSLDKARRELDPEAEVGDELLEKLDQRYGRIAAQAAKQNLIQRLRDAERDLIYNEFKDRKGEIADSGIVQRFEKKALIVNLGRTDAILPEKEQIPRERYRQGDRIRAFILDVDVSGRGPQIVLSRTHPGFLVKLFEKEVPEIYERIVEVKGAAREPGGRAKIAVTSHDRDVDPVGACVGMKGTRVQSVVQELRGEKIDIVPWSEDPAEYVVKALAPARVSRVVIDEDDHSMQVVVPDDQLSLAIGKKGQNVRLASRLTGWKLDVVSEAQAEDEAQRARQSLASIPNLSEEVVECLLQHGFKSVAEVAQADEAQLAEVDGLRAEAIPVLLATARERLREMDLLEAEPPRSVAGGGGEGAAESTNGDAEPAEGGAATTTEGRPSSGEAG